MKKRWPAGFKQQTMVISFLAALLLALFYLSFGYFVADLSPRELAANIQVAATRGQGAATLFLPEGLRLPDGKAIERVTKERAGKEVSEAGPLVQGSTTPEPLVEGRPLASTEPEGTNTVLPPQGPSGLPPDWFFFSFFENFVSDNQFETPLNNLYRDRAAAALTFMPDYLWEAPPDSLVSSKRQLFPERRFNPFRGGSDDRRCQADNCIEVFGSQLSLNGRTIDYSKDLSGASPIYISLGIVGDRFLVGFTVSEGQRYRGKVFELEGFALRPLTPEPIFSSEYAGRFGFGGLVDDFLIIYGAEDGIAYHVKPGRISEISNFFDYNMIGRGFQPEIIRAAAVGETHWYVYSSSRNKPWLMKLWQNGGQEIAGVSVFNHLFRYGDEEAEFRLAAAGPSEIVLLGRLRRAGRESWQVFRDRGFKNQQPATLLFREIPLRLGAGPFVFEKLESSRLQLDSSSASQVQLAFSADGQAWRHVPAERDISWETPPLHSYFLKVVFEPRQNRFHSPYLKSVGFDYYVKSVAGEAVASQEVPPAAPAPILPPVPTPATVSASFPVPVPAGSILVEISEDGFRPDVIKARAGEQISLALRSADKKAHSFMFSDGKLPELSTLIVAGATKVITFSVPAPGSYFWHDDIPAFRQNTGRLVVE